MKKLLIKILLKIGFLSYFNINFKISINNRNFKIPLLGKLGLYNLSITEPWMVQLLTHLFAVQKGTFLDIGVNVGQTLLKVKSVSPDIQYIGFEPNPSCLHYTKQLVRLNNFSAGDIIPVGLSTQNGILSLLLFNDTESDSGASIVENFRASSSVKSKIHVPIFTLETVQESIALSDVGFIKIDVEGAELEVLQSCKAMMIQNNPIVIIEILPAYNQENRNRIERQEAIEKMMQELNYSIYRTIKTDQLKGLQKIDHIGIHSDLNACEYVFLPNHLSAKVQQLLVN